MQRTAALVSLAACALAVAAVACESSGPPGYSCQSICDCAERPDDKGCLDDCETSHANVKNDADDLGCGSLYEAFVACLDEHALCSDVSHDLVVPKDACSKPLEALVTCQAPTTVSSSSSTGSSM